MSLDLNKPKRTKANIAAARLLLEKDKFTLDQVLWIINWVNHDSFWGPNIRSATKLREQFKVLKAKALAESNRTAPATSARFEAAIDVAQELRAMEEAERLEITA